MEKLNISKICPRCGCAFTSHKKNQKYCSSRCRTTIHIDKPIKRYCVYCHKELPTTKYKYCDYDCQLAFRGQQHPTNNIHKAGIQLSTSTMGALSELRVAIDLLSKGYSVFRAVSPNAPCDLIALKDNKPLRIEVKTINFANKDLHTIIKETGNTDYWAFVRPNEVIYYPKAL